MTDEQSGEELIREVPEAELPEQEPAEAAPEELPEENTDEVPEAELPQQPAAQKKPVGLIIALIAAVAVIAVLAVLLILSGRNKQPEAVGTPKQESTGTPAGETETVKRASPSFFREEKAFDDKLLDSVVATCGDSTLTNRKLAFYYWQEFYLLMNNYGSYITYMMDPYARLDEQYVSDEQSWDQMLMENSVQTYIGAASLCMKAKAEGYQLGEADQQTLDGFADELEAYALQYGFENADAYLHSSFGPYCSVADYVDFMEEYLTASAYISDYAEALDPTDAELEALYEQQRETYESSGFLKDDTKMIDVRHILIQPAAVELKTDDEGYEAAVKTADDEAKQRADEVYQLWLDGEQTEEHFIELAKEHSADGSASKGGLYEEVYPGQMVTEFNDWCFDASRTPGDTAIVKTRYGYHIMYFVGRCDETYWHQRMVEEYFDYMQNKLCEDAVAEYPAEIDLTKAAVYPCNLYF